MCPYLWVVESLDEPADRTLARTARAHQRHHAACRHGSLEMSSAAWGWLWNGRMLAYQCALFAAVVDAPADDEEAPRRAALSAYDTELAPFHNPVLRRVYRFGLPRTMPRRTAFLESCRGVCKAYSDTDVLAEMRRLVELWQPLLERMRAAYVESGLDASEIST